MITTEPRMTNLFLQLGLDASAEGIARFIREHQLATDVEVVEAPYWRSHGGSGAGQSPHPPRTVGARWGQSPLRRKGIRPHRSSTIGQYFQVNARRAVRPGAGITPRASGSR